MKYIISILIIALCNNIQAASLPSETKEINETALRHEYFDEKTVLYRGQHEIVKIYSPLSLMVKLGDESQKIILFFVEASRSEDGSNTDTQLYITDDKNNTKKLLENGRDVDGDGLGNVYFAASDGIYIYNSQENTASKYGSMSESIISIAAENNTGVIHALSGNHVLYTVTQNGTKADINDRVYDAQELAINVEEGNVYYYDSKKNVYVLNKSGEVNRIQRLKDNISSLKMVKPPSLFQVPGMLFIVDNQEVHMAFPNGTSMVLEKYNNFIKLFRPTAYSVESGVILYYSVDNKIYQYNVVSKIIEAIFGGIGDKIKRWLES